MPRLVLGSVDIGAAAGAAVCACAGSLRWRALTRSIRYNLQAKRLPGQRDVADLRQLETLPAPVQRYFRMCLHDRQPMIRTVRARHSGTFNLAETAENWKPFTSDQIVVTRPPGFDWDATVRVLPGVFVRVHDAYLDGEGILQAALFGLIPLATLRGSGPLAEGELMRFLAEAVWYPTALLPSEGVHWEAGDEHTAYGTLTDGDIRLRMVFAFDADGFVETISAESRSRPVGNRMIPTPWQCRLWNYDLRHGMRVPLDGEVSWMLPSGARPYWRRHIESIDYDFAP